MEYIQCNEDLDTFITHLQTWVSSERLAVIECGIQVLPMPALLRRFLHFYKPEATLGADGLSTLVFDNRDNSKLDYTDANGIRYCPYLASNEFQTTGTTRDNLMLCCFRVEEVAERYVWRLQQSIVGVPSQLPDIDHDVEYSSLHRDLLKCGSQLPTQVLNNLVGDIFSIESWRLPSLEKLEEFAKYLQVRLQTEYQLRKHPDPYYP